MYVNFETKKYSCMVNTETGDIIANEKSPRLSRTKIETNVKNKVNTFPYTDEDFIILDGRAVFEQEQAKTEKRVVGYGVDILIENDKENQIDLEKLITKALEESGLKVCGVEFKGDMTEYY